MITVSSEHIYSMVHLGICQRCTMLLGAHSLVAFFLPELGTDTHKCAGELPLILAPVEISDVPWLIQDQPGFPVSEN